MKHIATVLGAACMLVALPAAAQSMTGEEIRGQTVDVEFADGTRNSIFFGSTGVATISNPTTGQSVNGNWYAQGDQLCLTAGSATECWDYSSRFAAGQAMTLASTCNQQAMWRARSVNMPRQEVAPAATRGERG